MPDRFETEEPLDRDWLVPEGPQDDLVDPAPIAERRSFAERTGIAGLFGGGARTDRREAERRSQDRVLWVVATETLRRARFEDIEVRVEDAIVTLEGTVRSRDDKRRIEALVDQRGVRDVQNNLRIRDRGMF